MELQETLLHTTMDSDLAQEIKTTIYGVPIVHLNPKVPGGIQPASTQTSTLTTIMDYTQPQEVFGMVWCGPHGRDTAIPLELPR